MALAPIWYSAQARCHGLRTSNIVCVPPLISTGIVSIGAECDCALPSPSMPPARVRSKITPSVAM